MRGPQDLLQLVADVAVFGSLERNCAVAVNRGEQIVEIVRNAAGEPADRFQLLSLADLSQRVRRIRADAGEHGRTFRRTSGGKGLSTS